MCFFGTDTVFLERTVLRPGILGREPDAILGVNHPETSSPSDGNRLSLLAGLFDPLFASPGVDSMVLAWRLSENVDVAAGAGADGDGAIQSSVIPPIVLLAKPYHLPVQPHSPEISPGV